MFFLTLDLRSDNGKNKGQRTKQMILEKALVCFGKKGFDGATLFELAKAAKTHKPLIIHYFKSIENLQVEALQFAARVGREFTVNFLETEKKT